MQKPYKREIREIKMKPEFEIQDEQWAQDLERGVEAYTDGLFEAIWDNDEQAVSETLSGDVFCGCSTCFWREALFYITPKIIQGYKDGKVTLAE